MWEFKGEYTGGAKAYLQEKAKKEFKISIWVSIIMSIVGMIICLPVCEGNIGFILITVSSFLIIMPIMGSIFYVFEYKPKLRAQKGDIRITNDGFEFVSRGSRISVPFYKLAPIEYHDDFIVFAKKIVIQENIMVEGDWEELMAFLKKIEESLETEDPIYQLDDPDTEFFNATVKSKRVFKRFDGVQLVHSTFEYYATFILENGEEREYQLNQEIFEKIQEEQTGVLVLISGIFFSFGDGEDVEKV